MTSAVGGGSAWLCCVAPPGTGLQTEMHVRLAAAAALEGAAAEVRHGVRDDRVRALVGRAALRRLRLVADLAEAESAMESGALPRRSHDARRNNLRRRRVEVFARERTALGRLDAAVPVRVPAPRLGTPCGPARRHRPEEPGCRGCLPTTTGRSGTPTRCGPRSTTSSRCVPDEHRESTGRNPAAHRTRWKTGPVTQPRRMRKTDLMAHFVEHFAARGLTLRRRPTVEGDRRVHVPRMATFVLRQRPARTGHDPRTGEAIQIKAGKAVTVRVAQQLQDALQHGCACAGEESDASGEAERPCPGGPVIRARDRSAVGLSLDRRCRNRRRSKSRPGRADSRREAAWCCDGLRRSRRRS